MSRRVQLIRHSTAAADAFVGLQGEITVDTTVKELRVHDGLSAGGIAHARADLTNALEATPSAAGKLSAADKQKLDFLGLTQAADLDAIEALLAFITVTQAVNLDTIESDVAAAAAELAFIAITQAVDLDSLESIANASKVITDWLTVTQAVDLDTLESNVATNNAKVSNATHTGDVTGDTALAIAADKVLTAMILDSNVTLAKLANITTASFMGRNTAGSGVPEVLSATVARAILNVANGANAYSHPNHTGDVTSSGDGATTIVANAVTETKIIDGAISRDKMKSADSGGEVAGTHLEVTLNTGVTWIKFIEFITPYGGTFNFSWEHRRVVSAGQCESRIYRNGSGVGTVKTTTSTTFVFVTDTVSSWSAGDLIQLYHRITDAGSDSEVQDFKIIESAVRSLVELEV